MLKKTIKGRILGIAIFSILFTVAIFLLPDFAFAQIDTGLNEVSGTGLSDTDPRVVVARVIRVALGFLGVVALVLILFAGWLYMTSGGAPDKVDKAKKILSSAAVGLVIVLSAFAIASFILNALLGSVGSGTGGGGGGGGGGFNSGVPTSGNSIIESHYPERNQRDVPRNTSIVITFKEAINPGEMINDDYNPGAGNILGDWDDLNFNGRVDAGEPHDTINENFALLYKQVDGSTNLLTDAYARVSSDHKTFLFKPIAPAYLGSPSESIEYVMALSEQLRKENGDRAFSGLTGYEWSFEVSTIIDVSPPRITSIIPKINSLEPMNVVVQVNFNEAVNPFAVTGATADGFDNLVVSEWLEPLPNIVEGNFYISNRYRTVEFLTESLCGRNSCGDNVYCLPATSSIEVLIKAATLVSPPNPTAYFDSTTGFDGVIDMADNSLDGNKDGITQGQTSIYDANAVPLDPTQGDSYRWDFRTTDKVDLSAPYIIDTYPNIGDTDVDQRDNVTATFNKYMMSSSMVKHTSSSYGSVGFYTDDDKPFWLAKKDDDINNRTTIEIRHDRLSDFGTTTPIFKEGLKDIYQNCFYATAGTDDLTSTICNPTPTSTSPIEPYCCDGSPSTLPCN